MYIIADHVFVDLINLAELVKKIASIVFKKMDLGHQYLPRTALLPTTKTLPTQKNCGSAVGSFSNINKLLTTFAKKSYSYHLGRLR